jgi:hypothetical protein
MRFTEIGVVLSGMMIGLLIGMVGDVECDISYCRTHEEALRKNRTHWAYKIARATSFFLALFPLATVRCTHVCWLFVSIP